MTFISGATYWGEDDGRYVLVAYDFNDNTHEVHSIPVSEMANWLLLNLWGTSGLLGVWSEPKKITWVGLWNDIERGRIKYNPIENAKPVCPYCGCGLNLHSPYADDWYCTECGKDFTANRLERIGKTWLEFDAFIADYFDYGWRNDSFDLEGE